MAGRLSTGDAGLVRSAPPAADGRSMKHDAPAELHALLDRQQGVIARWQAAGAGMDLQLVDGRLRRGRWQWLYRGIYATFTGPPPRLAVLWAGLLRAGPGAVLSHWTAAELDQLTDQPSAATHVTVPSARRVAIAEHGRHMPRVLIHYSARTYFHPARIPCRTRVEETTLDLAGCASTAEEAMSWPIRACARRVTTPHLLGAALAGRARLRWRPELTGALAEARDGVQSLLESRYVRWVERPHGLPPASRQVRSRVSGRTRYLDDLYREYGLAVELDGQASHPAEARWRDIRRDNATVTRGIVTLRYSWGDVTDEPCRVAAEVAAVLRQRGWRDRPRPCGPRCSVSHGMIR